MNRLLSAVPRILLLSISVSVVFGHNRKQTPKSSNSDFDYILCHGKIENGILRISADDADVISKNITEICTHLNVTTLWNQKIHWDNLEPVALPKLTKFEVYLEHNEDFFEFIGKYGWEKLMLFDKNTISNFNSSITEIPSLKSILFGKGVDVDITVNGIKFFVYSPNEIFPEFTIDGFDPAPIVKSLFGC